MRRRVMLIAPPFSGHLHPLIGIGQRLQGDVDVTVVSTPGGVRTANECGLEGHAILAGHEHRVCQIAEPGQSVRSNPIRLWRQFRANVALLTSMKRECDALLQAYAPTLVIADFTVPVAGLSARQHGIAWWTTLPSPCVFETPDGPPAYFGGQLPATTTLRHARHAAMRAATRGFKRGMSHLVRRELRETGFDGVYRPDGSEAAFSPERILALTIPELEFARTYPPHFRFIGPVLFTPSYDGPQPNFHTDGRPHVLVSIGTHLQHAKRALADVVHGIASRLPGVVFHFSHGGADTGGMRQAATCHEYAYVSYAEHLPRYELVVHHGGAGIMHHCLRLGVPSVVYPLDYDQFDHAARLVAAGVALRARGAGALEGAIVQALGDARLRTNCAAMRSIHARNNAEDTLAQLVTEMANV